MHSDSQSKETQSIGSNNEHKGTSSNMISTSSMDNGLRRHTSSGDEVALQEMSIISMIWMLCAHLARRIKCHNIILVYVGANVFKLF